MSEQHAIAGNTAEETPVVVDIKALVEKYTAELLKHNLDHFTGELQHRSSVTESEAEKVRTAKQLADDAAENLREARATYAARESERVSTEVMLKFWQRVQNLVALVQELEEEAERLRLVVSAHEKRDKVMAGVLRQNANAFKSAEERERALRQAILDLLNFHGEGKKGILDSLEEIATIGSKAFESGRTLATGDIETIGKLRASIEEQLRVPQAPVILEEAELTFAILEMPPLIIDKKTDEVPPDVNPEQVNDDESQIGDGQEADEAEGEGGELIPIRYTTLAATAKIGGAPIENLDAEPLEE